MKYANYSLSLEYIIIIGSISIDVQLWMAAMLKSVA